MHRDGDLPSLTVYEDGFHCFGCGASGDVIDLVMQFEGLDFMSAVEKLNRRTIFDMPQRIERTVVTKQASPQASPRKVSWQKKANGIIEGAVRLLAAPEGKPGRDYLISRGFEPATWQKWRLGFLILKAPVGNNEMVSGW